VPENLGQAASREIVARVTLPAGEFIERRTRRAPPDSLFLVLRVRGRGAARRVSRRMASEEGATIMSGTIIPETEIEIDADRLEPAEKWTARDFVL
jgi:hypothetical protein